ncbi:SDR family NAD(P)-dependent oxidoreductase [Ornithinimicrobium avium]|uniref:SDR family NAD(P)-dependent oxidoreductase n=1 Tax=Ornithinimicrobium avium TaxID=2283195 RepID=A0A345NMF5_9MICO|nr:SDR family NAD(P)-dependent oxidoreductase [Ornithinimicrobium avium]
MGAGPGASPGCAARRGSRGYAVTRPRRPRRPRREAAVIAVGGRSRGGAVVTGAGQGLGRQIAVRLARAGFEVHLTDVDADLAARAAQEIAAEIARQAAGDVGGSQAAGPARVLAAALDVRDQDACRRVAASAVEESGTLALWVNNAGVLATGPAWEHTDGERRLMLEVNALGTMHGTVAALEQMRPAGRGHVVNVASLAALAPVPGEAVYAASKHAVLGLSLSMLADLRVAGEKGVRISCVCPDGMWTPMLQERLDDPGAAMSFSGVLLRPEQVADLVMRVVERPRAVVTAPRWRGLEARVLDLAPGLAVRLAPLVVRVARRQQSATARRLRRVSPAARAPAARP